MELRHLQALTAISDHGTFSAAAEHLTTVQSNISAHVARLERELGAPLIDRSDGRLTEEGTVVVARARRILHELDALVSDVAACKDEVTGTVRVGMIGTTARWLVPRLMDVVRKRHPKLRLVVMEGTTTGLEPQLASGQLDLAVLNLPATAIPPFLRARFHPVPIDGLPRRRIGVAQRSRGLPSAPTRALHELLNTVVAQPEGRPEGVHVAGAPGARSAGHSSGPLGSRHILHSLGLPGADWSSSMTSNPNR